MSNMQFDTGTVAVATVDGKPNVRVMRVRWLYDGGFWAAAGDGERGLYEDDRVTDIRPLVVLDLDEYDWLPNRLRIHGAEMGGVTGEKLRRLADQIEQQTKPPKPEEPTGLGAVVEDAEGRQWVRNCGCPRGIGSEWRQGHGGTRTPYSSINAVRVLSEGVQS